jgi:hypothetical protein
MYKVRQFKKEHLYSLKVGAKTHEMVDFLGIEQFSKSLQVNGPAYSGFYGDEVVLIAGVNVLWQGMGEAWAMLGVKAHEHGMFCHRNTIKYLNSIQKDFKLQRIQAVVLKKHYAGIEWVDRLGFSYEGTMEAYFNGEDYLRYAKIFEVE